MRTLIMFALLCPISALAQLDLLSQTNSFYRLESGPYFNYGSNFSMLAIPNLTIDGLEYAHSINFAWNGFDADEEPIDEIIVTAKRRVNRGWELWMYMDLNLSGNEICTNYTDFGHCNVTQTVYDLARIPIAGICQTEEGQLGPLTGQQANELNAEYINEGQVGSTIVTIATTGVGLGLGGWPGGLIGAMGGVVTSISGFVGELPFTAEDNVVWSLTVCNDGEGGVDANMNVTIN